MRSNLALNCSESRLVEPADGTLSRATRHGTRPAPAVRRRALQFPTSSIYPKPYSPKRAAILSENDLERVRAHLLATSRAFESAWAAVLLSRKAGLRVGEIASLRRHAFTNADGSVADSISVWSSKSRRVRDVPLHRELKEALIKLVTAYPDTDAVAFTIGRRGPRPQSAATLCSWFHRLYREVGLYNCSSHSGRRTFATLMARACAANSASLHDLQKVIGHAQLSTTEAYIELSDNMGELINAI